MKILQLLVIAILLFSACSYKNTTQFWKKTLNLQNILYQSYSGYQQIDWYYAKNQSGMFYNLFGAFGHDVMTQSDQVPLIVWLQGGPGSGSQFGAFTELGPIRIFNNTPTSFNYPWNILGHLLFIDSPLNAGFSFQGQRLGTSQVSSTNQATDHLLNFFTNFFKEFPSLRKSPMYITGQSYAGHYIPNLAKKILANETFLKATGVKLVGVAIGDGWTDPINQVNYFDSLLWSAGIVSNKFRDVCTWYQTHSIINIYQGNYANATSYFNFFVDNKTTLQNFMGNISSYNFRNYDGLDKTFAQFLNKNRNQLGASVQYIPSNPNIYSAFSSDISRSFATDVIAVLRSIKVLIFNGQIDVIVNTAGVLQYLNSLNWEGINQWKRSPKQIWTNYGQVVGWVKNSGNLWFALVNGAGHMVPTDKPVQAFSLMGHFIHNDNHWKQ